MDPTLFLWLGGALILIAIGVGIFTSISNQRSAEEQRIGEFVEPEQISKKDKPSSTAVVTDWLSKKVVKTSWGDRVAKDLAQADLKLKSGEYLSILIGSTVLLAVIGWFLGGGTIPLAIAGAVFGFLLPGIYVKSQKNKRLVKFNNQLGDMLGLMVNGLRAGYSNLQAMEAVSKELPAPISEEFRRVVQEVQLGVTVEKALDNLVRRIPSEDLDLVVTAMKVQREVGGNLAEILDTISHTIRERVKLKGEIRVLTAQMRYSGSFLSLLPVFVVIMLYIINREYIMTMVDKEMNAPVPCGYIAIVASILLIIVGYIVLTKLADIEV